MYYFQKDVAKAFYFKQPLPGNAYNAKQTNTCKNLYFYMVKHVFTLLKKTFIPFVYEFQNCGSINNSCNHAYSHVDRRFPHATPLCQQKRKPIVLYAPRAEAKLLNFLRAADTALSLAGTVGEKKKI